MFKNVLILIIIAVLAAIAALTGLRILHWIIASLINVAIFILAIMGVLFLLKKLKSK